MPNRQSPDAAGFKAENEIDVVLGNANPNPSRLGCPPRDVLAALARRNRPIDDPAYDHLIKCSPCYREVRALQQSSATKPIGVRSRAWWPAAAAAALIIVSAAGGWYLRYRSEVPAPVAETARVSSPVELTANVDLRKHSVVRSQDKQPQLEPVSLPRGRVRATIQLPAGFEPGAYEIQVLDADLRSRASATGTGELRDYVTTVEATLDMSGLPPGSYQLAIRRQGEDWRLFPANVK